MTNVLTSAFHPGRGEMDIPGQGFVPLISVWLHATMRQPALEFGPRKIAGKLMGEDKR